jgi:hypothetical protein
MASAVDRMVLDTQAALLRARYPDERFDVAALELVVHHLGLPSRTGETYALRYDFGTSFDDGPPSVLFCDAVTFAVGHRTDWPSGPDRLFKLPPTNGPGWICTPMTREGRAHHSEWISLGLWEPQRPLESIVATMRELLQLHDLTPRATAL